MKITLAIDSFKGSLTSAEAEQAAKQAILPYNKDCQVDCIPIADGGEGTLPVLMEHLHGSTHIVHAHNPCMDIIPATYGISGDGHTAFIEMASINGLPLLTEAQRNPMHTTTYGTGELIRDALDKGCRQFIIGIGGSATNDAGTGMLQALGYRFLDTQRDELKQGGKILKDIAYIDESQKDKRLKNAHFIVICDVENPFYGPNGAAYVYARQKGATEQMIKELDEGMQRFAKVVEATTGKDISTLPGSGAAGGLGGSLHAFLHAELKPGAEILLKLSQFHQRIADTDLIITGEGKIDQQSLMGKITGKILQAGQAQGVPVVAIAGCIEDKSQLMKAGFKGVYATRPAGMPLEKAMQREIAMQCVKETVLQILNTGYTDNLI